MIAGQPYADFWSVTLREYWLVITAANTRQQNRFDAKRVFQQELAHLFHFAVHDLENMPDFTAEVQPKQARNSDENLAKEQLRAVMIGLNANNKKGS